MNNNNLQNTPGIGPGHKPQQSLINRGVERTNMNPMASQSELYSNAGFGSDSHTGTNPTPYHERYLAQSLPSIRLHR